MPKKKPIQCREPETLTYLAKSDDEHWALTKTRWQDGAGQFHESLYVDNLISHQPSSIAAVTIEPGLKVPTKLRDVMIQMARCAYAIGKDKGKREAAKHQRELLREALGFDELASDVADRVGDRLADGFSLGSSDIPF